MNGQIILNVTLPPLSTNHIIKTFKIMPRSGNAHAYINAGFCAEISRENTIRIVGKPTIIFGGIRSSLVSFITYSHLECVPHLMKNDRRYTRSRLRIS
jgi:xanthine dehydrogenase/oxidase